MGNRAKILEFDLTKKRDKERRWCARCQVVVSLEERREARTGKRAEDDRIAEAEERRILEINLRMLAAKGIVPSNT